MPCISDPGHEIVSLCAEHGYDISVIPGPCAAVTAIAGSGFDLSRFVFEGFLPSRGNERKKRITQISSCEMTSILYEAPHRIIKILSEFRDSAGGERKICIAREMTKKHEEFLHCTIDDAINHFETTPPKGEFVIIIEGIGQAKSKKDDIDAAKSINDATIRELINEGAAAKQIVRIISDKTGMTRNEKIGRAHV